MEISKLKTRFRQFGGLKLVKEYSRLGVLWPLVGKFFKYFLAGKSVTEFYPEVEKRVVPILEKQYGPLIQPLWEKYEAQAQHGSNCGKIWFFWKQGIDNAPDMVKACLGSLKKNLGDREIVPLDKENMLSYISIPEVMLRKWQAGVIPEAAFSNLVRLELLAKYGGTWIDSTVLCTGKNYPREYLDSDLFMFRYNRPGSQGPVSISTWFITSASNNTSLLVLRDLLYAYWQDHDCLLFYYIMHRFYSMITKRHPEAVAQMPYAPSQASIALLDNWGKTFNPQKWEGLTSRVAFHKLSFRPPKEVVQDKSNYYNEILRLYQ